MLKEQSKQAQLKTHLPPNDVPAFPYGRVTDGSSIKLVHSDQTRPRRARKIFCLSLPRGPHHNGPYVEHDGNATLVFDERRIFAGFGYRCSLTRRDISTTVSMALFVDVFPNA